MAIRKMGTAAGIEIVTLGLVGEFKGCRIDADYGVFRSAGFERAFYHDFEFAGGSDVYTGFDTNGYPLIDNSIGGKYIRAVGSRPHLVGGYDRWNGGLRLQGSNTGAAGKQGAAKYMKTGKEDWIYSHFAVFAGRCSKLCH